MDTVQSNLQGQGRILTACFRNREDAEQAYQATINHGYNREEINVVVSDQTRDKYFSTKTTTAGTTTDTSSEITETKTLEGLGTGSAIGGTIGALTAAVAAIGTSVVLPGLGVIVAGPLAAGLAGAGAGSIAGGLAGALVGSGITEAEAKNYESDIKSGCIMLAVNPHSAQDERELESEWLKYKAEKIHH